MEKTIMFFIGGWMLLTACQRESLPFYAEEHHIYWSYSNAEKRIDYSFVYSRNADEDTLYLPVKYTGRLLDEDAGYGVEVVADSTTALSGEYELPSQPLFRGGRFRDTLQLRIHNTDRLKQTGVRLELRLVSNAVFQASLRDSSVIDIYYTNQISQPLWWNEEVVLYYLGSYSDEKLLEFVKIYSGDYGALSGDDKLYYARKFKYELERRAADHDPVYEKNGELMTVPVTG